MKLKYLFLFITIIYSHSLVKPNSIENFINELNYEHDEISKMINLSKDKSCILQILKDSITKCDLENDQFDRREIAIDLTKCIFEYNEQMPNLPIECNNIKKGKNNIDLCIGKIANDGIFWTTYFGYTNLVESFCSYYSNDLTRLRTMDDYDLILTNLKDLIIKYNQSVDFNIEEMNNKMFQMIFNIQVQFSSLNEQIKENQGKLEQLRKENIEMYNIHWIEFDSKLKMMMQKVSKSQESLIEDTSINLEKITHKHNLLNLKRLNSLSIKMDDIIAEKIGNGKISFIEIGVLTIVIVFSLASGRPILFIIGMVIGVHLAF